MMNSPGSSNEKNAIAESVSDSSKISVSLLTGGADRPYVFGLGTALMTKVDQLDVIGSDDLVFAEFEHCPTVKFFNLRGSHQSDASISEKIWRLLTYYIKLIVYAAVARPKIFHILWNNKFETFDRTLLTLYYRLLGKKVVLTLHNVNAGKRDQNDTWLNRVTLRAQYHLAQQIFVHTEQMKTELVEEFGIRASRVTVIPFGINNAVPITTLRNSDAKTALGCSQDQKVILFFGNITPYKGVEYLISAFRNISVLDGSYRLVIAGKPDRFPEYWDGIRKSISKELDQRSILIRDSFIPDSEVEIYFKAADVLVLPYRHVYQSGVMFLGQSFGLPVIATDVGSLKDDIVEHKNGFVVRPDDPEDLARALKDYFGSALYMELESRRADVRKYAADRHSWETVGQITTDIYSTVLEIPLSNGRFESKDQCKKQVMRSA
jgi:D-inositol-3-phosphate glycosyltransferase